MNKLQRINKCDNIPDVIFDPNSYEIGEKEMLNQLWKIRFLNFTTKGNGGAYTTKSKRPCTCQH